MSGSKPIGQRRIVVLVLRALRSSGCQSQECSAGSCSIISIGIYLLQQTTLYWWIVALCTV